MHAKSQELAMTSRRTTLSNRRLGLGEGMKRVHDTTRHIVFLPLMLGRS